jgi:tryptophanase
MPRTIFEPFRIKSVEPIRVTSTEERVRLLEAAHLNPFRLHSQDVLLDFLTDSGTGAMSAKQWGAIMEGDESYAGSPSYFRLEKVVHGLTGYRHLIPTHQGRAAEHILFQVAAKPGDVIPSNTHFDTTRANIDVPRAASPRPAHAPRAARSLEPSTPSRATSTSPDASRRCSRSVRGRVPFGMITLTNNSGGGPAVRAWRTCAGLPRCSSHATASPSIIDACRFAENAMFIKRARARPGERSPVEIAREIFSLADGCTMSAKKDGMANIGGLLATRTTTAWPRAAREGPADPHRGLPHLRGPRGARPRGHRRGPRGGARPESYLRYRLRTA